MKKDIDSATVRRNLRSNTVKERYWKTKISVIVAMLIVLLIISMLYKKDKLNSSEKNVTENTSVAETDDTLSKSNTKNIPSSAKSIIIASGSSIGDLYTDFKNKMAAKNRSGITYSYINSKIRRSVKPFEFECEIQEVGNGFSNFSLVFNPVNKAPESKQNVLQRNAGSQPLADGVIDKYEYHLIGLK